jgi:hypothetical protein
MIMKFRIGITAVISSMFIMITLSAPGLSQVVKESFEYTEGTLDAQGEATDGWAGPWIMSAGDVLVIDGNMDPDSEGRSVETVQSPGEELTFYRSLADLWPDNGEAYWIGFMFQRRDDGVLSSWGGLSLFLDDAELLFMGSPGLANRVGIECSGVSAAQNSEVSDLELSWVVVKLAMNGVADNDSVYLWVNPDPAQEPDIANADARGAFKGSDGFNRIRIGNDGGYILAYDMIRLGNSFAQIADVGTGVSTDKSINVARTFGLMQNYPNPFNPTTNITYSLPRRASVKLQVFDLSGHSIKTLVDEEQTPGTYTVPFDGTRLTSGVYIYRLQSGNQMITKKMMLLK